MKTPTAPAAATRTAVPVTPAVPQVTASLTELERKAKKEKEKIKKHQKNMLKIIHGEPITEESDSEPDDRNMPMGGSDQAIAAAVVVMITTDPARLVGATLLQETTSKDQNGHGGNEKETVEKVRQIRTDDSDDGLYDGEAPGWSISPAVVAAPMPAPAPTPTPTLPMAQAHAPRSSPKPDPPPGAPIGPKKWLTGNLPTATKVCQKCASH